MMVFADLIPLLDRTIPVLLNIYFLNFLINSYPITCKNVKRKNACDIYEITFS